MYAEKFILFLETRNCGESTRSWSCCYNVSKGPSIRENVIPWFTCAWKFNVFHES